MSVTPYTEIYGLIYSALTIDGLSQESSQSFARRVTDAIWDLHLSLNFGEKQLNQTIETVRNVVDSQIGKPKITP